MPQSTIESDLAIRGLLTATQVGLPAGCVGDTQVNASNPITAPKLQHQHRFGLNQVHGSAATSERRAVYRARGTGTLQQINAGVVVANVGGATITVDLRKNGTTVLSSVITLNNSQIAYQSVSGTISSAGYVVGDVLEVVVTATVGGGTLGQGLFVEIVSREAAD